MFQLVVLKELFCGISCDKRNQKVVCFYKLSLLAVKWVLLIGVLLIFLTVNTASASGLSSPINKGFFENEQSIFVLAPATVGSVVGSVAGAGLGIPLSILIAIPATLLAGEPGYGALGMYLGIAVGSGVMSSVIAAPFWAAKKLFYDLPFQ